MAKKTIGAITLLRAKKYWTLVVLVGSMIPGGYTAGSYLGVRNAQEGNLEEEVEHKATHSSCGDTFAQRYVVRDIGKAWPDSCEQDDHALTTSRGLDTM